MPLYAIVQRLMFGANSLEQIFLIASDKVKDNSNRIETEFGNVTHLEFLKHRIEKEFPDLAEKFFEKFGESSRLWR